MLEHPPFKIGCEANIETGIGVPRHANKAHGGLASEKDYPHVKGNWLRG